MNPIPNQKPFTLRGSWHFRARNLAWLMVASSKVSFRRAFHGPGLPGWSWGAETGVAFLREQFSYAFDCQNIADGREYLDTIIFHAPVLDRMDVEWVDEGVTGVWFRPKKLKDDRPILFFPGGGYVFMSLASATLHALISEATGRQLFALNYPLAPENPFPAQLLAAEQAYAWMVEAQSNKPESLVLGGASAGGNLCLALLLKLRDQGKRQPAQAFLLSPWVDMGNSGASMTANEPADWISKKTCELAAGWFLGQERAENPLVSPLNADLHHLAPIYIQAGGAEIFIDMIRNFAGRAETQGVPCQLDVWQRMIHCFQSFGENIPEARAALQRLGEVVNRGSFAGFPYDGAA